MNDLFWQKFDHGKFILNVLALIKNKEGKILIGRRKNDPFIKNLSWCFPGGRPAYDSDMEEYLKLEVKKKTNYNIKVGDFLFAKTYPEDRRFLSIYYQAQLLSTQEKPAEKFVELKWIKPDELKKYFTTSLHPKLLEKIKKLKCKTK